MMVIIQPKSLCNAIFSEIYVTYAEFISQYFIIIIQTIEIYDMVFQ